MARKSRIGLKSSISLYTVSRELGHGSEEMVRRVDAHLGSVRNRSVVEFRVEQHLEALKDRLGALGFVTAKDTTVGRGTDKETPRVQ